MSNNNDTILAFFIGAIAGAATALLLAPQSGQETRQAIRRGAVDLKHRGGELYDSARSTVTRRAQDVSERVGETAQTVREGAKARVDAVKEAASEAKATYRREMERTAE